MKIKNLFAVAALLLGSTSAFAQGTDYEYSADGLDYTCNVNGTVYTATVKGVTEGSEAPATLTILAKITPTGTGAVAAISGKEFNVQKIGANAFKGKTAITKIELPASIKEIGASAFEGLTELTVANFTWAPSAANSVIFAGTYTLPRKVVTIGESAFENTGLTTLSLGTKSNLKTVGGFFIQGTAITEIDFTPAESNLTAIADNAFSSTTLKKVIFAKDLDEETGLYDYENDQITAIPVTAGVSMFTGATAIEEIVFPGALTSIAEGALAQTVLKTLDLSHTGIAANGIENLFTASATLPFASLTSVALPNAETAIKAGAFAYCTGLTTITIPAAWATNQLVKDNAFKGCTGLTTVNFEPTDPTAFTVAAATHYGLFQKDAFADCNSVSIATTEDYAVTYMGTNAAGTTNAPTKCKYSYTATVIEDDIWAISFATGSNNQAFKYMNSTKTENATSGGCKISKDDAIVYSVYVDDDGTTDSDGTIYIFPYRVSAGYYWVDVDEPFIIKAKDGKTTVNALRVPALGWPGSTKVYPAGAGDLDINLTAGVTVTSLTPAGEYLYVGAIKNGVLGFGKPASNSMAKGQYFVTSKKAYSASGRLNVVWVDENDATAIQTIQTKAAAKNGAIYNLAGQKVNAAYKGVVIKDGKKYIQK